MRVHHNFATALLFSFFVTIAAPWELSAQTKSGIVNSRDQILGPTANQQQQAQKQINQTLPPAGKGKPGPLPCNSKNNPKCDNESPSKPGDGNKGNNGVGNGVDPQPPGNPPINDAPGTGPGNPGAKSR